MATITTIEELKEREEEEVFEFGFQFISNLDKRYAVADLEQKRQIIGSTFPEKLIFEHNACRTASNDPILLLIANTSKDLNKKRKQIRSF